MLYTRDSLTIIGETARDQLRIGDFRIRMDAKGWSREDTSRALVSMERRGWVSIATGLLTVSDAGYAAATTGEGVRKRVTKVTKPDTKPGRVKHARMPRGLF